MTTNSVPDPLPQSPDASDPDAMQPTEGSVDASQVPMSEGGTANEGPETIGATADAANTTEKDPDAWVTGDEPMTGAQRSYLDTLARQAGEELPADLTKAEASQHIDRLQEQTGRGA